MLFWRIVIYVLLIGVLSGLLLTALQFREMIPASQSTQRFEGETTVAQDRTTQSGQTSHEHPTGVWGDSVDTPMSNVLLTAVGFFLVILASIVALLKRNTSTRLDWQYGLLWGVSGYTFLFLAPVAFGLMWGS